MKSSLSTLLVTYWKKKLYNYSPLQKYQEISVGIMRIKFTAHRAPNTALNQTTCKQRLQLLSALRAPAAG